LAEDIQKLDETKDTKPEKEEDNLAEKSVVLEGHGEE
jgi:hypothetical protein